MWVRRLEPAYGDMKLAEPLKHRFDPRFLHLVEVMASDRLFLERSIYQGHLASFRISIISRH